MKNVPTRLQSGVTALARIVIAKTIDELVPQWIELGDKQGLTERNRLTTFDTSFKSFAFIWHSQITNTRHPNSLKRLVFPSSRRLFALSFSVQKVTLEFGIRAK